MNCVMCQRTMIRPFSRETTPQLCVCEMEHYQCLECDEHMARHCGFCGEITHLLSVKLRLELELDVPMPAKGLRPGKPGNEGKIITLWQNDCLKDFTRYNSRTNLVEKKRSRSEVPARKSSPVKPRRRSNSLDGERHSYPESPMWENTSSQGSEENTEVQEEQPSSEGTLKGERPVEENVCEISKPAMLEKSGKSEKSEEPGKSQRSEESGKSQGSEKSKKSRKSRRSRKSDKSEKQEMLEEAPQEAPQEALEKLEKAKTKKSETQGKPKRLELEEKPENLEAFARAKQENKPVSVDRNVPGPRNNYSLSLLASDPPNTDQNALCNLISMVK